MTLEPTLQGFLLLNPVQRRPEDPLDVGSLTRLVAASIHCQPERVNKQGPLHQSWGALFFWANETTGQSTERWWFRCSCSANQLELLVVTLLRQGETHHLTLIDRPDWSAEALVKHA